MIVNAGRLSLEAHSCAEASVNPLRNELPAFAEVVPEIPLVMIHTDRCNIIWSERNVPVPTHMYHATFAGDHLIEALPVPEPHRNDLIAGPGFALPAKIFPPFARYGN